MNLRGAFPFYVIALLGFSAVALGAAGAHATGDPEHAKLASQASLYHLIHTVALLALNSYVGRAAFFARGCWLLGIVLFCGSLYAKAFGLIEHAYLAPAGGILLMAGWLCIAMLKPHNKAA